MRLRRPSERAFVVPVGATTSNTIKSFFYVSVIAAPPWGNVSVITTSPLLLQDQLILGFQCCVNMSTNFGSNPAEPEKSIGVTQHRSMVYDWKQWSSVRNPNAVQYKNISGHSACAGDMLRTSCTIEARVIQMCSYHSFFVVPAQQP